MSEYAIPEEPPTPGCKVCGKTGEEMPRRGPYANRCAVHRQEVADRIRAGGRKGGASLGPRGTHDGDSFEAKAKTLVSHGRRVDSALADVRLRALGLNDAKTLAREALEQWKQACLRLASAGERG